MRGVSRPCSPARKRSCPALYAPSADNDTWAYTGGPYSIGWKKLGHLGDSGQVYIDPARQREVAHARNGRIEVFTSEQNSPPDPSTPSRFIEPSGFVNGSAPPGIAGLSEVMTLPTETPLDEGDYVAVQRIATPTGPRDRIVRRRSSSGWFAVTPNATFPAGPDTDSVSAVAAAGGHRSTIIYAISNGTIFRADFGPSGVSSDSRAWKPA